MADLADLAVTASFLAISSIVRLSTCIQNEEKDDDEELHILLRALRTRHRQTRNHTRIQGFVEEIVPCYSLTDFKRSFRLTSSTFEVLLEIFGNRCEIPQKLDRGGRPPVSVEKHLLITLWFLGNQEPFRCVADRFNVAESCTYKCLRRVCQALKNMAGVFIAWPKGERARTVLCEFQEKRGIPGVIGAIDGSHIPIKAPTSCPENYINRKGFHSVVLQAVSDHEMMFTDCYVGWPGSVHDARVLSNSDLYSSADEKFQEHSFLLGDSAYPLKPWLMTPCKDFGNLTAQKKHYNFLQSSTRMVIERSFASLKGRFRKLKYMDMDIKHIPETVIATCVLHNLCLVDGDDAEEFIEQVDEVEVNNFQNILPNDQRAEDKRGQLIQQLYAMRSH